MKIRTNNDMAVSPTRHVEIQVAEGERWIDFGYMNYTERKDLANQLRTMANELMKVAGER